MLPMKNGVVVIAIDMPPRVNSIGEARLFPVHLAIQANGLVHGYLYLLAPPVAADADGRGYSVRVIHPRGHLEPLGQFQFGFALVPHR